MAHRMAKLNVFGRQLLVGRIEQEGWTAARAAEAQGVSRATVHKWIKRYRAEGLSEPLWILFLASHVSS